MQVAGPTAGPRARQIRGSPLPVAQGIPISLRTGRQGWTANRAPRHLDISNRREHGLQGRLSPMGGPAAGWGITVRHAADLLVWQPQRPGLRRAVGADRHRLAATNNAPLPAPGMEWGPGNRPPEADPNPTCAMGRTSRPPAAAYVQYRGMKPTAHPCVVAHRHR